MIPSTSFLFLAALLACNQPPLENQQADATEVPCSQCSGDVVTETEFVPSADGKECMVEVEHCVTLDGCPMHSPMLPANFCPDGQVVHAAMTYVDGADGNECLVPSVHCVTTNPAACPDFGALLSQDYCADGDRVASAPAYVPSADGMECEVPVIHCVTTQPEACGITAD